MVYVLLSTVLVFASCNTYHEDVSRIEKWSMYEITLSGPAVGNPFKEVSLKAEFRSEDRTVSIKGFYAGRGEYKVRFMPDREGEWIWRTMSNVTELDGKEGQFRCVVPSEDNHGPVEVFNTYHFRYADGTPYKQVGTTCYAWIHQGDSLEHITLETLGKAPFNKLRMCVFPKDYSYNQNEPVYYPFERDSLRNNDYSRFNPEFWDHLDKRILDLQNLGIEADIILFHPYDRWGYSIMPDTTDEFYLQYILARLSAYRNVWWSAANEFDLMHNKSMPDWHRIFEILYKNDPYNHLRSIHNCVEFYDHTLPWITHASIQSTEFDRAEEWRTEYKKPLVYDECRYEGDVRFGWGNLTPEEMTAMFWKSLITGTYAGHGETYEHPEDILWWSKGGELHGASPERIAFFKAILEETPETGLEPINAHAAGKYEEQYIWYFGEEAPTEWSFDLPDHIFYRVEVIDTWNMTRDTLGQSFSDRFTIDLPAREYMAVRITKSDLMFPIKKPDYWPHGSLFHEQVRIHLVHPYPETLRYTLDGSRPDETSSTYTGPILISEGTSLRVLSIEDNRSSEMLKVDLQQADLKPALEPETPVNGLKYAYYTGKWETMPDFTNLKPVKTGRVENIDLSIAEDEDYFGIVYEGYIRVPEDDVYTFYSSSDDGSFIFIDGIRVVENDGVHGIIEKMGQIGLKAGFHRFRVEFFDNWYDHSLRIEIESQNTPRKIITSEMLYYSK